MHITLPEAPDGLAEAFADLEARGKGWQEKLEMAFGKCRREYAEVVEQAARYRGRQ